MGDREFVDQIAVGAMQLNRGNTHAVRRCGAAQKGIAHLVHVLTRHFGGGGSAASCGRAEGPNVSHPPCALESELGSFPGQGAGEHCARHGPVECTPARAVPARGRGAGCRPRRLRCGPQAQAGRGMRPSGTTAVASMVNNPAPLLSGLPQCIRCQSVALSILGGILAHRRDDDPVGQGEATRGVMAGCRV